MKAEIIPVAWPVAPLPDAGVLAGQLTAGSIAEYRRNVAAYVAWCRDTGRAPTIAPSLVAYRVHLAADTQHAPATINRALSAVKRLVQEAAALGQIDADTAQQFAGVKGVKANTLRDRQRAHNRTRIEPVDMRRLADAPDRSTLKGKRDAALLAVLAGSGLRAHEAAGLPITAIRKQGRGYVLAVVGKGKANAEDAPLKHEAYDLIMEWIDARPILSQYIFTAFAGRGQASRATAAPMSATSIWRTVQEYAAACGLEHIKPHDLRRFMGTQIVARTGDIRKAQKALRHKSIETTARHYVLDELEGDLTEGLY